MEATVLPMHLNYKQHNTCVYVLRFVLSYSIHRYNATHTDSLIHCILSLQIFMRMHGFAQDYYNREWHRVLNEYNKHLIPQGSCGRRDILWTLIRMGWSELV